LVERLKLILDDMQFYSLRGGRLAKYLLLRIDMEEWDMENFQGYEGVITLEHIPPAEPPDSSVWLLKFNDKDRKDWTNRLGNLTLLSGRKNSKAGVKPFAEKKNVYFKIKTTPFKITQDLAKNEDWDMDSLKKRHEEMIDKAIRIYVDKVEGK